VVAGTLTVPTRFKLQQPMVSGEFYEARIAYPDGTFSDWVPLTATHFNPEGTSFAMLVFPHQTVVLEGRTGRPEADGSITYSSPGPRATMVPEPTTLLGILSGIGLLVFLIHWKRKEES